MRDLMNNSRIYFDPSPDENTQIEDDGLFLKLSDDIDEMVGMETNKSPWIIRMEFNDFKMQDYGIKMIDLQFVINKHYGDVVKCKTSDDSAEKKIMRLQLSLESDDMMLQLKALEQSILDSIIISGIRGVNKAQLDCNTHLEYDKTLGKFVNVMEWYMITDGSNLETILHNPMVDYTRTISNNIVEIYEIFGIEAARNALLHEISDVLKQVTVDYHHFSLLVDTITQKGVLQSIDRHGINRSDVGPLSKASFEESSKMLVNAGMFAELDKMNGITSNVMTGQIAKVGTGSSKIIVDQSKLPMAASSVVTNTKSDVTIDFSTECTKETLSFDYELPEANTNNDFIMSL
jgi:DNA-directed RNA polymerase II subunit RPB1